MNNCLQKNLIITAFGKTQLCSLHLGVYANSARPAFTLMVQDTFEPYSILTVNPPPNSLHGYDKYCFAVKTWSENTGLWEQVIEQLKLPGFPTRLKPVLRQCGTPVHITCGHGTAEVWFISSTAWAENLDAVLAQHHERSHP